MVLQSRLLCNAMPVQVFTFSGALVIIWLYIPHLPFILFVTINLCGVPWQEELLLEEKEAASIELSGGLLRACKVQGGVEVCCPGS